MQKGSKFIFLELLRFTERVEEGAFEGHCPSLIQDGRCVPALGN